MTMRSLSLFVAFGVLSLVGCSAFVRSSGTDLSEIETRDQVHEEFGKPITSRAEDGKVFKEIQTLARSPHSRDRATECFL